MTLHGRAPASSHATSDRSLAPSGPGPHRPTPAQPRSHRRQGGRRTRATLRIGEKPSDESSTRTTAELPLKPVPLLAIPYLASAHERSRRGLGQTPSRCHCRAATHPRTLRQTTRHTQGAGPSLGSGVLSLEAAEAPTSGRLRQLGANVETNTRVLITAGRQAHRRRRLNAATLSGVPRRYRAERKSGTSGFPCGGGSTAIARSDGRLWELVGSPLGRS